MDVLLYNELDETKIPGFAKLRRLLEADDFQSADVKKIGPNLYRCRLDVRHRLLFSIYRHQGRRYALILEFIAHHAYEKSRFLRRGVKIDEGRIPTPEQMDEEAGTLSYLHERRKTFHILDKVISFDADQQSVYELPPPWIVIGSAGSGKTALILEKMKQAIGDVLYVTHSPYLVENSRDIYYSHGYRNPDQQVDFFSFREFLESIHVPSGREAGFSDFLRWFGDRRRLPPADDAHKLFEEFKGVITGMLGADGWLNREEYLGLGIKQSIFLPEERAEVYDLFEEYLRFLQRQSLYDSNIVCHRYLASCEPRYDFVVIDEVQDITNVQLALILRSLRQDGEFIICGDSNQIVHPNFFSWSKVKSFFHRRRDAYSQPRELIRVLQTNYRNSPEVTEVANRLLKLKNARFGSIDKESHYLIESHAHRRGNVCFLRDTEQVRAELESKTRHSTRFAVIVMREEMKEQARRHFSTPLVFSVQEAKGLEYENIILYNFVASDPKRFSSIAEGVEADDLQVDELRYARVKDKRDKSLEIHKFHINALYVAITRAIDSLYLIERDPKHPLLRLIGLRDAQDSLELAEQNSCLDEWREEARKLELQGKTDQAEEIRKRILQQKTVEWRPLTGEALSELEESALVQGEKKARIELLEYALLHHDMRRVNELALAGFVPARRAARGLETLQRKHYSAYTFKNHSTILRKVEQYGVDFRDRFHHTPLMLAARFGNLPLVEKLCEVGADIELVNNHGLNAWQIALEQACNHPKFAERSLPALYEMIAPAEITLRIDGRLRKLPRHGMEYMLLNFMMAGFYHLLPRAWLLSRRGLFSAVLLESVLAHFPETVLPAHRKKRAYISSMLSKNERDSADPYNRKILLRVRRGHYLPNPAMAIRQGEEWIPIYERLRPAALSIDPAKLWGRYQDLAHVEKAMESLRALFASLSSPE